MTFTDIERVLGFSLPPSARRHPAWWSNNRGTNVAVSAWRSQGFRTARVDVPGERVVFVREAEGTGAGAPPASVAEGEPAVIVVPRAGLTPGALRLLQDYAEELGKGLGEAAAFALNASAAERRRRLVDEFAALSPLVAGDSADLVREDRDGR